MMSSGFSMSSRDNHRVLLVQLPIPQLNFGRQTGNIPLAAGCLKMAASAAGVTGVEILPQRLATYLGDAALLDAILSREPSIVGFSVYAWNVDRCLYLAEQLKAHGQVHILFGGPEITPDNPSIQSRAVDACVYGDGEAAFVRLLSGRADDLAADDDRIFEQGSSPYLAGLLEPEIENMILVETQRGCPYRCGYCYYGKSRRRLSAVPPGRVIEAIAWARHQELAEAYLLDPCLNSRRDLADLLASLARVNGRNPIKLISEIRAEAIDDRMADGFAGAGFTWFEVGLQSTNPAALKVMNRPTDLNAFIRGTNRLKDRGIRVGIDLIAGLPGDDPGGFSRTLDVVVENGLADDVQVFPLSILPGTPFRAASEKLGIVFDRHPPYTVVETPTFSGPAIAAAMREAEDRFDLSLYPLPDLDLSGCSQRFLSTAANTICRAAIADVDVIIKTLINQQPDQRLLAQWASRLTHPYQIVFGPKVTDEQMRCRVISQFTTLNPLTPLEVIVIEPPRPPDLHRLLSAARLQRPHYLDKDLSYLYPQAGNRAMLMTLLSRSDQLFFQGDMCRQVFWWTRTRLPLAAELERLAYLDGVFIPDTFSTAAVCQWQEVISPQCHDLPAITFADAAMQKRWIRLTLSDDYWFDVLPTEGDII
jgi:hypothetical protein